MPLYGVSIEKQTSYRGGVQPFSNVYYYDSQIASSSLTDLEALIDALVVLEKRVHATVVSFERGRLWTAGGTPSQNQMLVDKALSGSGSATNADFRDRERAELIQWRAGVDSRGRPVYLRKWYHTCAAGFDGTAGYANNVHGQTAGLSTTSRTAIAAFGDEISDIAINSQTNTLVAESGRTITGLNAESHPYLEHRQLGDEWRAS